MFTKRAGDAQTNESTMTYADNGFRKKEARADAEITGSHIDHSAKQDVFISPLIFLFL